MTDLANSYMYVPLIRYYCLVNASGSTFLLWAHTSCC